MVFGYESVLAVLRRRGFVPVPHGQARDILLPLDGPRVLSGEEFNQFLGYFGKASFRKLARRIIAARGETVGRGDFERLAGAKASEYLAFLEKLGVAEHGAGGTRLTRRVDNLGPTLEWYVAELCKRELAGDAEWSVQIEDLPIGGEFDVLAWLAPQLVYVELKSAHPSQVSASELKTFLQRSVELAVDIAILLIDTSDDLSELLVRISEVIAPIAHGNRDPDAHFELKPGELLMKPQMGFPNVSFGYFRTYVTNSDPLILTQLRRCLQHYHTTAKMQRFHGSPRGNFVTGVADEA